MLDAQIEQTIKQEAISRLGLRPDWDIPHTLNAVRWIKELVANEGGNEKILVPAIYFHDIGTKQLPKGYNNDEILDAKVGHAQRSALIAEKLLTDLNGYFSTAEIDRIKYLIINHDIHDNITEPDRQLVFEADSLSQIDFLTVKPNFDKKNCQIWFKDSYLVRKQFIKTKTALSAIEKMEPIAIEYIKNLRD